MKIVNESNNMYPIGRIYKKPTSKEEFTQKRTQEKSEKDVCEREYDPISEST